MESAIVTIPTEAITQSVTRRIASEPKIETPVEEITVVETVNRDSARSSRNRHTSDRKRRASASFGCRA